MEQEQTTHQASAHKRLGYGPIAAVLVTVAVFFAAQVVVVVILSLLPLVTGWNTAQLRQWQGQTWGRFVANTLFMGATLGLLVAFLRSRKVKPAAIGLIKPRWSDLFYTLSGYGIYFLSFVAITQISKLLVPVLDLNQEQQIGFSTSTSGPMLILVFICLVVLPAVIEEITFRGFLYTGLRTKLHKVGAALIVSAIFAVAHLQLGSGAALLWVAALDTFVLSLILVYLRETTGSLWSPILVHMIKNGLAFLVLFVFGL